MLWIPTGAPGYRAAPVAAATDRVAMLQLALAGEPRCVIDERELRPGASGYTYDTVRSIQAEHPGVRPVLLLGADQYAKRESWYRWKDLIQLCEIAVYTRPGWTVAVEKARKIFITLLEGSASDIRARLGRGEDVSALLPAAVLGYIREHRLYRG